MNILCYLAPEPARSKDVGFIHQRQMSVPSSRDPECKIGYPSYLSFGITLRIVCDPYLRSAVRQYVITAVRITVTEVDASGQFPDHHDVHLINILDGRCILKLFKHYRRSQVRIQTESRPQPQKCSLRSQRGFDAVPLWASDGAEEYCIRCPAPFKCLIRQRHAILIYGAAACKEFLIIDPESELILYSVQHAQCGIDYLGTYSVTFDDGYLILIHCLTSSSCNPAVRPHRLCS